MHTGPLGNRFQAKLLEALVSFKNAQITTG